MSTIQEVETALTPYFEVAATTMLKDMSVERTKRLMAHIGNPEKKLKIIHIAGTSGKTSTTYYTAALLQAAGQKVGFTVSPHVDSLTERVQIDGRPLSEAKFCQYMSEFLILVHGVDEMPSWYELMIGFALWVFVQEKVDYAMLETGLGGLHDSTNVAERYDKVCVITDIALDHQHILGETVAQIAAQKAGIIHPGNAVLMYTQTDDIMQVVRFKTIQTDDAELYVQDQDTLAKIYGGSFNPDMPDYQRRNWLMAYAAYRFVVNRDGIRLVDQKKLAQTQTVVVPARMETRQVGDVSVVMDGAHNEAKMTAFAASFQKKYGQRRVPVLLALKQSKDYQSIAPLIVKFASQAIVTTFSHSQDLPTESIDPQEIAEVLQKGGLEEAVCVTNPYEAYEKLLGLGSDLVVVTGSFYLISQLRARNLSDS